MSLQIQTEEHSGVAVLRICGDITLGSASADLRDAFKAGLGSAKRGVLLDLEQVEYIDSGGLGELIRCHVSAAAAGKPVKFCCPQARVRTLFSITKLSAVFETFDGPSVAVESFPQV